MALKNQESFRERNILQEKTSKEMKVLALRYKLNKLKGDNLKIVQVLNKPLQHSNYNDAKDINNKIKV